MAGKSSNILIYNFSQFAKTWSWGTNFGSNWGVGIVIPLPPPVSFIQISLNMNFGYQIGLALQAILTAGTKFQVTAYVGAGLTTSAEVGVRVLFAEGGAYISGTIASIGVSPSLTLWYAVQSMDVNVSWNLVWNVFQFRWGLYYKWCYIFGCGGRNEITSWIVSNGVTKSWLIYSTTFYIYF